MTISEKFKTWGLGFSGCDGGDLGTAENPSIWICGIEWGGGHTAEGLVSSMSEDLTTPPRGYESWEENLTYIFNWQVMKLLSVINGGAFSEYKMFAQTIKPFVNGESGYFKMNLYPIGFKDTSQARWHEKFSEITGFKDKSDYLAWCSKFRLPKIREWTERAKPKLILCLGKTYLDDFKVAFHDAGKELYHEVIDGRDLYWDFNDQGSLVAVIPFMVNRYGLVKNVSIQKFGNRISELLTS